MKTGTEQLTKYAAYHRDRRNIATHLFGIPLIVFAALVLLGRINIGSIAGYAITGATIAWIITSLYYIKLDLQLGVLMTLLHGLLLWAATPFASTSTEFWLATGVGIFVFGWVLQFIGHFYEGKKPAFVDDLVGLVIGPMFVVTEVVFFLGLRKSLRDAIEQQVGPTIIREKVRAQS